MRLENFEKLPEEKQWRILSAGIAAFSGNSYKDVSTDQITQACSISKGLLFHYFGSKKDFYLYCLEKSMERLMEKTEEMEADNFYDILFSNMDRKMALCMKYQEQMRMVNMASRDASAQIAREKMLILGRYRNLIHSQSQEMLSKAISCLDLKDSIQISKAAEALHIYVNGVINQYLLRYQQTPDRFFADRKKIKEEMKEYLDLMLFGICG